MNQDEFGQLSLRVDIILQTLQDVYERYGNTPVVVCDGEDGVARSIWGIEYEPTRNAVKIVLID